MNIGLKIKQIRTYDLITQKEVAKHLGINVKTYQQYELQYCIIPTKHLNTLANFFNISIDYIFENNKEHNYQSSINDINKKDAGKRLKEFRKENKISQSKLAQILNTTDTVISGYETGRYLIATPFLYTISKKYNISADYLLGKINEPKYLK